MMPGSARYHITSNYLFTYGKWDESKIRCRRKGSEKRRREINKSRRHLMKTGRRKLDKMSKEMRKKMRQEITCTRKGSNNRDCRVLYGTFAHVVPGVLLPRFNPKCVEDGYWALVPMSWNQVARVWRYGVRLWMRSLSKMKCSPIDKVFKEKFEWIEVENPYL